MSIFRWDWWYKERDVVARFGYAMFGLMTVVAALARIGSAQSLFQRDVAAMIILSLLASMSILVGCDVVVNDCMEKKFWIRWVEGRRYRIYCAMVGCYLCVIFSALHSEAMDRMLMTVLMFATLASIGVFLSVHDAFTCRDCKRSASACVDGA